MNGQIFEIFWNFKPPGIHILTTFDTEKGRPYFDGPYMIYQTRRYGSKLRQKIRGRPLS